MSFLDAKSELQNCPPKISLESYFTEAVILVIIASVMTLFI